MIKVLEKLGPNKKIMNILSSAGWKGNYTTFAMQKNRGSLTADVALILWEYCLNKHIPVSRQDFYEVGAK